MKKTGTLLLAFLIFSLPVSARISFGSPDINQNDEVVFTIKQDMAGTNPYKSLFYSKLKDGEPEKQPELLTCYPERMELLDNSNILQIRNRYGVARYWASTDSLTWTYKTENLPVNSLPIVPYAVSYNGKYFCRIERTDVCSGSLILEDSITGKTVVLCDNVLNTYESLPVKWALDSSMLIYEKNNQLYFCNPEAILRGIEIEEKYRMIGRGSINSVFWASSKYLAYVDDYLLYRINTKELYTIGLYSGIIGQGKAMGRLPFKFDSQTDYFSCNSDVTSIVVMQNKRLCSYLKVQSLSCDYMDVIYSRPYTDNTASLVDTFIFWDKSDLPVIWQEKLPYDNKLEKGVVYKLSDKIQKVLEIQDSGKPFISPDNSRVAFFAGSVIYVYDINTWQRVAELSGEKITSALWANRNVLYVGGEKSLRRWNLLANTVETITLASVNAGYWDSDNSIIADTGSGSYFRYNKERKTWKKLSVIPEVNPVKQNGRYRVFLGKTANNRFENALYVRTLGKNAVTKPIFTQSSQKKENQKKVALVFDAYDNVDGLSNILTLLKKYNITGTFFLNGEFIRRYPLETKQIVTNGYECCSMFFTTTNLTENSFVIDEDFIRRGLARNEDEFYQCTGSELSLYWHAPYYKVDPKIIEYGENAGYSYINALFEKFDFEDVSSRDIIQSYYKQINKLNGGVVPVTVGFSQNKNSDYLYNHLDLLICALLDAGFDIVSVDEL